MTRVSRIGLFIAVSFAVAGVCGYCAQQEEPQLPVWNSRQPSGAPNTFRILFIGDSITRHQADSNTIAHLGWDHVAGMAASDESKDYAHLLGRRIQATLPDRKVELYFDKYGNMSIGDTPSVAEKIEPMKPLMPNLVVIQLGEHESSKIGMDVFREKYEELVTAFDHWNPHPIVITTGPWAPPKDGISSYEDDGHAAQLQRIMSEVSAHHRIPFVSVQDLAEDPACRGWGQNPGVQWHPNDKGQAGYADKLWAAYQESASGGAPH
jgi:hypothetical protein